VRWAKPPCIEARYPFAPVAFVRLGVGVGVVVGVVGVVDVVGVVVVIGSVCVVVVIGVVGGDVVGVVGVVFGVDDFVGVGDFEGVADRDEDGVPGDTTTLAGLLTPTLPAGREVLVCAPVF
jgi:hypothetical protein